MEKQNECLKKRRELIEERSNEIFSRKARVQNQRVELLKNMKWSGVKHEDDKKESISPRGWG